jgi:hypothetical protein
MPFQEELSRELRRTTKAKLAVLLPADHRRTEIAPSDPEVKLAAEVHARARALQERCPGARTRAPHQKGAQSDRRLSRYQLDGVKQRQVKSRAHVSKMTTGSQE